MGYTQAKWLGRIRNRTDISGYLSHLTKEHCDRSAVQNLVKILEERTIVGSSNSGYVAGRFSATCFQDVPLYSLCQNTYHEQIYRNELGGKIRYSPIGLAFLKSYIYSKGGRPVIYEKLEVAKKLLQEDEWWRIVSFDLSNKQEIIDWTHEREWRFKGNFEFAIEKAYI